MQFYPAEAIENDELYEMFDRSYPVTLKGIPLETFKYLGRPHLVFDMDDLVHCVAFYERLLSDA